jgi:hypothetical protein
MNAVSSPPADPIVRACGTGRFVPYFRNRPIGSETLRAEAGASGRIRLRAETEIAIHKFDLRQTVVAEFAADLRPRFCTVEAVVNARPFSLELEVERDRAVVASRSGTERRSALCDITRPPLLLVDNCFASHAFAALAAARHAPAIDAFLSLPACEELHLTRPGVLKVLLGGREFTPPALSLHLTPDLDEHVWLLGDWIERLVIPQTQMRIEWTANLPPPGGHP